MTTGHDRTAFAELVSASNATRGRLVGMFPTDADAQIARANLDAALGELSAAAVAMVTGSGSSDRLGAAADDVDAAASLALEVLSGRRGLYGAPDVGLIAEAARLAAEGWPW